MRNNEKKNKHMTLDDRIEIQECLSKGMTFIWACPSRQKKIFDIARDRQKFCVKVNKYFQSDETQEGEGN